MKSKRNFSRIRNYFNLGNKKNIAFWVFGCMAFLWVLIRTGTNPKRLSYPCQQTALPLAASWFIAALGILGGVIVLKRLIRFSFLASIVILLGISSISSVKQIQALTMEDLPTWEVANPVSIVAVIDSIAPTSGSLAAADASVPDSYLSDPAMDSLAALLNKLGTPLYKTTSNSNGLIGADDIVIIKGNFQWDLRLGTSTDRIKGLIWLLLNHPDNFTGEILVCDNTQQFSFIDHDKNNSEDTEQSIIDVVNTFYAKGYPVYLEKWKDFRETEVSEYQSGDMADGYVYNDETKISYPKFQTPSGNHYLSLRYGIWDTGSSSYSSSKLSIINFPVLKAHGSAGATIAVKNWIGVLTTADQPDRYGGYDSMHDYYFWGDYALVARVMALTYPKLNIIDATWTAGKNNYQQNSSTTYNTGKLVASTDPVAASWYAAKFILQDLAQNPQRVDPDDPDSEYGSILRKWNGFLADSAGLPCTLDSSRISVYNNSFSGTPPVLNSINKQAVNSEESDFLVFPNPASDEWSVRLKDNADNSAVVDIYNSAGKLLQKYSIPLSPGINDYKFKNKLLSSGVYHIIITTEKNVRSEMLIIK